jgi:3-hydroxyacyl-CoA dehydrogenase
MLAECDLVIEAIIEQVEPKRTLYEKLENLLPAHTIVASNTSGIPMEQLLAGRSAAFRSRFLGMHFFNPPRYLHLLEIIPTPRTSPETLTAVTRFSERVLGKGIVLAKDVPGFVANRLGVYGMVLAIDLTEKYGLSIGTGARSRKVGHVSNSRPHGARRAWSRHDRAQSGHRREVHALEMGA